MNPAVEPMLMIRPLPCSKHGGGSDQVVAKNMSHIRLS